MRYDPICTYLIKTRKTIRTNMIDMFNRLLCALLSVQKTASIVFGSIVCVTGGFATTLGGYLADHFKADETPLALRKTCLTIMVLLSFSFSLASNPPPPTYLT